MVGFTKTLAAAGFAASLWTVPAMAQISETEPNNTLANATAISRPATGPFASVGIESLTANDVDVFSLVLSANELLTFNTAPLSITPGLDTPDTAIALVNSGGTIVAINDDIGPTDFGSAIQYLVPSSGTYFLAVTGSDDAAAAAVGGTFGSGSFSGAHPETGQYALTVSVVQVPEPASIGLIGAVGLLGLRRRRH